MGRRRRHVPQRPPQLERVAYPRYRAGAIERQSSIREARLARLSLRGRCEGSAARGHLC